ncbi:hypothetical protein KC851_01905 [Candidatus Kaiserbacteria bacterium]|nr:hypothetical protein [Candidatus Kaiserbacteria bacterium]
MTTTKSFTRLLAIMFAAVLAVATFSLYTLEASADRGNRGGDDNGTEIEIENSARVSNDVQVTAKTGGNEADGGDSGDRDRGGKPMTLRFPGGQSSGNAGPGGDGGTITTGAASAIGTVYNDVNNTRVTVEGCGCEEGSRYHFLSRFSRDNDDDESLEVDVENRAKVRNELDVTAKTGGNEAEGGDSNGGGSNYSPWHHWLNLMNPGGGDGGTIRTGAAYADGMVTNLLNHSVVRVDRGGNNEM